jgi:hypothetical protein
MESQEIEGSELGTIKYLSELLGWDIKRTANLFILILIFVFDPLAITLVIATNQAFKGDKKDETPQPPLNHPPTIPQVEEETDQVPTKHRPSTNQVIEEEVFIPIQPKIEPIIIERRTLELPDIDEKPWKEPIEEEKPKRLIYKK